MTSGNDVRCFSITTCVEDLSGPANDARRANMMIQKEEQGKGQAGERTHPEEPETSGAIYPTFNDVRASAYRPRPL